MGLMDRFAKLDSAMQRGLDNGFARVFGGNVVPAEIEEALKQEAEDNRVHTYEGYIEAPNRYTVNVSQQDADNLYEHHPDLEASLADLMTRHIRNQGWVAAGTVVVRLQANESLKTGQMKIEHEIAEDTTHAEDAEEAMHTEDPKHITLLLQDGSSRTYGVREGSNIIGRGQDADLRLPDTGVSREHVEITWNGEDAVLTDLQSTNGTTVNDMPVDNWMLADGDVITVGHSRIEVRITRG